MRKEKIILWKDSKRDENKEDKTAGLLEHLKQYNLEIVESFDFMPMVIVKATSKQCEVLSNDSEILIEDNGEVRAFGDNKNPPGKVPNCS